MYKKRTITILALLLAIQITLFHPSVKGHYPLVSFNLETDNNYYYADGQIRIEAWWRLECDINEYCFVQVQLYNETNGLIWTSEEYEEEEINMHEIWFVNITDLEYSCFIKTNFSLKFHIFYKILGQGPIHDYFPMKSIQITKKIISCNITNIESVLNYGDSFQFQANFYNTTDSSTILLNNHPINLKITNYNGIVYERNYFSVNGIVKINISTLDFSGIGYLELKLTATSDKIFNEGSFLRHLNVTKMKPNHTIMNYTENVKYRDNFLLIIKFFYEFANKTLPLVNLSIHLKIFSRNILVYENIYTTSNEGLLVVNLSSIIFYHDGEKEINILISNHTYIENYSINLVFDLYNIQNEISLNLLSNATTIIFFGAISGMGGALIYKRRKKINRSIFDISFKY